MAKETKRPQPREVKTVTIADSSYQPSRSELREDLRLKGTFDDAIKALVRPVKIRRAMPRKLKR